MCSLVVLLSQHVAVLVVPCLAFNYACEAVPRGRPCSTVPEHHNATAGLNDTRVRSMDAWSASIGSTHTPPAQWLRRCLKGQLGGNENISSRESRVR